MKNKSPKNKCYALLAIAQKQLQMSEDAYREFLAQHGAGMKNGKISASTMSIGELNAAVEDLKAKGFVPVRQNKVTKLKDWRTPRIKKIKALWHCLADAGVVKDRDESAMQSWCSTLTKKKRLEWCDSIDLNKCIEALKRWCNRTGVEYDT